MTAAFLDDRARAELAHLGELHRQDFEALARAEAGLCIWEKPNGYECGEQAEQGLIYCAPHERAHRREYGDVPCTTESQRAEITRVAHETVGGVFRELAQRTRVAQEQAAAPRPHRLFGFMEDRDYTDTAADLPQIAPEWQISVGRNRFTRRYYADLSYLEPGVFGSLRVAQHACRAGGYRTADEAIRFVVEIAAEHDAAFTERSAS